MTELSRDEVAEILGRVSDAVAAEIIATGISKEEIAGGTRSRRARPERSQPRLSAQAGSVCPGRRYPGASARDVRRGRLHPRI